MINIIPPHLRYHTPVHSSVLNSLKRKTGQKKILVSLLEVMAIAGTVVTEGLKGTDSLNWNGLKAVFRIQACQDGLHKKR